MAQQQPRPQISIIGILMRKGAWMVPLGLVFAALAGLAAMMEQRDARALDARGVETTAIVTSTERRVRRDSDGGRRVTHYARYRFDLPDGQTNHNRTIVTRRYYNAVSQGDEVWVRYLPDEPDIAEIERGRAREGAIVFALAALFLGGGSVWLGWRSWQRSIPMIRAGRHGERLSARVLGHFKTLSGSDKNKKETLLFKLRWVDSQGKEGISDVKRRAEELQAWPKGSEITVYADPESGQTFWEQDLAAR